MENRDHFTKTKPMALFMKTAIPGGISMLASSLYYLFEALFAGNLIGTTALSALGMAMPISVINFAVADMIGVGSSVVISIALGKKEDDKANNCFTCASIFIVLAGMITGLLLQLLAAPYMRFMGAEGELLSMGVAYIRVYAAASPVITMVYAVDNFLRISGKNKVSMLLNMLLCAMTIALEFVFIRVCDLGVRGSALGGVISTAFCAVAGYSLFLSGKLQLKLVRPQFSFRLLKEIVKNGSPIFLTTTSSRAVAMLMNVLLFKAGGADAVAIYLVLTSIGDIIEKFLYGMMDSMQPVIGYNYGAREYGRVKLLEKYTLISGAVISFVVSSFLMAFPAQIAAPFLQDASLIGTAVVALRLYGATYFFKWIGNGIQSFLLTIERSAAALAISLCSTFVFPIIVVVAFAPFGLNGLWMNYGATTILTGVLAIALIAKNAKKLFPASDDCDEEDR